MNPEPLNEAQQRIIAQAQKDMAVAAERLRLEHKQPLIIDTGAKSAPIKFTAYCKQRMPQASGIARRAARKALKDNHRAARMDLARRRKNDQA